VGALLRSHLCVNGCLGRACRGVVRDKGCYPCEEDTVKLQVKDRLLISLWKSRSQNISKRAMRVVDVFARC
jgi:hypothetical protein